MNKYEVWVVTYYVPNPFDPSGWELEFGGVFSTREKGMKAALKAKETYPNTSIGPFTLDEELPIETIEWEGLEQL
jgi:hypothetical protein